MNGHGKETPQCVSSLLIRKKCNKDGICVYECPARIIAMPSKGSVPEQTQNFDERCLRCGHCVAVCPTGALRLDWLAPKDCPSVNKEAHLDTLQAEQFLRAPPFLPGL